MDTPLHEALGRTMGESGYRVKCRCPGCKAGHSATVARTRAKKAGKSVLPAESAPVATHPGNGAGSTFPQVTSPDMTMPSEPAVTDPIATPANAAELFADAIAQCLADSDGSVFTITCNTMREKRKILFLAKQYAEDNPDSRFNFNTKPVNLVVRLWFETPVIEETAVAETVTTPKRAAMPTVTMPLAWLMSPVKSPTVTPVATADSKSRLSWLASFTAKSETPTTTRAMPVIRFHYRNRPGFCQVYFGGYHPCTYGADGTYTLDGTPICSEHYHALRNVGQKRLSYQRV